jgi:amino acid adenylation domain-containing protein
MAFEAITSLVRGAVERFPDRIAVDAPRGRLTYAELDGKADGIAVALREAGAGARAVVPVLTGDRAEFAAAVLGVLRVGGVVVPLDVGAGRHTLAQVLADTAPAHVLVGDDAAALADDLVAPGVTTIPLGTTKPAERDAYPAHTPGPDDPCYVFFTSGSTGRPKGILGRLGSIDHYVRWETGFLGVDETWRVSQLVSVAFDAVLRDLFVPLTRGGTVCVPPDETRLDPVALASWLDAERIDLVHSVVTVFRPLLDVDGPRYPALRCVALSGEKLPPADARRFLDRFGDRVTLLNLYGPSETTMTKLFHVVTREDTERPSVPVGEPMPDTEVLLLDDRGREVPAGQVGEIHLATPHRSLGYFRQPEATAAAFVPDPRRPGEVLYRTGDHGRLLPGGALEFLGRKDNQVKIGGVRVELDGVEHVLRTHPAVTEAAVVLAGDRLCAFVEPATGVDPDDVTGYLRARLPEVAVPSVVVPGDIPRTISGKIDRRSLRVPDARPTSGEVVGPRTATERAIADIWRSVLHVREVDVRRRFLDAGGTSMAVIDVLARLQRDLGVVVPVLDFLRNSSVEALAVLVEASLTEDDDLLES